MAKKGGGWACNFNAVLKDSALPDGLSSVVSLYCNVTPLAPLAILFRMRWTKMMRTWMRLATSGRNSLRRLLAGSVAYPVAMRTRVEEASLAMPGTYWLAITAPMG